MTRVPASVLDYWCKAFAGRPLCDHDRFVLTVSETLNPKRPAMMLEQEDGAVRAAVSPDVAERIAAQGVARLSARDLRVHLDLAGVALHDPDYLFYLPDTVRQVPDFETSPRLLTEADRAAFDQFHQAASEQDREDAFVELDHWAVVGVFEKGRLVSAASMCLWADSPVADLGVLTLPDARGRGFARAVVQSINAVSKQRGHEPQYRCQLYNHASVALARSCGFVPFGEWTVAADAVS